MQVFKYTLDAALGCRTQMLLPFKNKIVHVGMQDKHITLWVEVKQSLLTVTEEFYVFGTGHTIPENLSLVHIGTVFDGPFVWHVYQVKEVK